MGYQAGERAWGRGWQQLRSDPSLSYKFHVDKTSGMVVGILVAVTNESDKDANHIHFWYDNRSKQTGFQEKVGGVHDYNSAWAQLVYNECKSEIDSMVAGF